jgi:hypothetical protein
VRVRSERARWNEGRLHGRGLRLLRLLRLRLRLVLLVLVLLALRRLRRRLAVLARTTCTRRMLLRW